MKKVRILLWIVLPLFGASLVSCSGGGSGGSASLDGQPFVLQSGLYGRLIEEDGVARVVSPYTTVETDPVTGAVIPGTLNTLADGIDIDQLVTLGIGANYLPHVVPRDGALVLEFNATVDPSSIIADQFSPDGTLLSAGSIRVRDQLGRAIPVTLITVEDRVWIDPVVEGTVGFPPSPVVLGPNGEARADATGFLRLIVPTGAPVVVRALDGRSLAPRGDLLGSSSGNPIGFNPGNAVLDFLVQDELVFTNETFNGFLPDLTAPRIIREHRLETTLDFVAGDSATGSSFVDSAGSFDTRANNGAGEWAASRLVLRPGQPDEEIRIVSTNSSTTVLVQTAFDHPPTDGDAVRLTRAEFFEPDSDFPIDPRLFDPNNPQNAANSRLGSFVRAFEIDAAGNAIGEPLDIFQSLPAYCELRVQFNEPMDESSFLEWETFRVAFNPDPGPRAELVTQIQFNSTLDEAAIRPVRLDEAGAIAEVVGWGSGVKALQLELFVVPPVSFLQQRMNGEELQDFLDTGVRGLHDLGGRSLSFPVSLFDPADPSIVYREAFFTDEAVSSLDVPLVSRDWGMLVNRFQGRPVTGSDSSGRSGVRFVDRDGIYSPTADVNLMANGRLAGPPVVYLTKIHDDFYPPPDGQFGAFPLGTTTPLEHFVTPSDGSAPWGFQGARFQQVFRDVDASPGRDGLAGTLLDLYRVSWAPIGGNVTPDTYEDVSLHVGHSPDRPITQQNGAKAAFPTSGLNEMFDYMTYEDRYHRDIVVCPETQPLETPNHLPGPGNYVTCVPAGTPYKLASANFFTPPFDNNVYHPWPAFKTVFQYNNGDLPQSEKDARRAFNDVTAGQGKGRPWIDRRNSNHDNVGGDSLLLEIRLRPQTTPISGNNGFTFSPGVLIDRFPFFRAFSRGEFENPLWPDNIAGDIRAQCATANTDLAETLWGDNSRYFAVFDYVKTTATVRSEHARVFPGSLEAPRYFTPRIEPPLSELPPGTQLILEYEGAVNTRGGGGTGYGPHPSIGDGKPNLAFRVTMIGNQTTLLAPSLDTLAIPYIKN